MRLPGTRYQEHGWERVRKLLGACGLPLFRQIDMRRLLDRAQEQELLDWYAEAMALALDQIGKSGRGQAAGNSYGDTVVELAQSLVCELRALPGFWAGFVQAVCAEYQKNGAFWEQHNADGILRKKINDMFAGLRDKVDADNYQVALGRPCSPNKIYTYRMLDTAYGEIARIFLNWQENRAQVAAILARDIVGMPIEVKRLKSIRDCKAEWVIGWSASLDQFGNGPGPLHTKSKRFSSLKNSPEKIQDLLDEIAEYEALSCNLDAGADWQRDTDSACEWLHDYWRVLHQSEQADMHSDQDQDQDRNQNRTQGEEGDMPDLLAAFSALDGMAGSPCAQEGDDPPPDELAFAEQQDDLDNLRAISDESPDTPPDDDDIGAANLLAVWQAAGLIRLDGMDPAADKAQADAGDVARAGAVSLPPDYIGLAKAAEDVDSLMYRAMQTETLPLRLAVYQKILGAWDESYPEVWLDRDTGELPNMQQLAGLNGISVPTLRKRRDAAIARLQEQARLV